MGEVGVFDPDERVELLDGEIVFMSPIGPKHAGVVNRLNTYLVRRLADRATVIPQNPVRLLPRSEPQPDVTVARARRDFYQSAHPTAEDILLVIEVADSSIRTDRSVKVPIYARQGIVEVWLVDLAADVVHTYSDPQDGKYHATRTLTADEVLRPVALSEVEFTVAEVLGR